MSTGRVSNGLSDTSKSCRDVSPLILDEISANWFALEIECCDVVVISYALWDDSQLIIGE